MSLQKHRFQELKSMFKEAESAMKKSASTTLLDKAHLWTVRGLFGITVIGCVTLGLQVIQYYRTVRPLRLEERRVNRELEIALEQQEREAELVRRQKEAENLVG